MPIKYDKDYTIKRFNDFTNKKDFNKLYDEDFILWSKKTCDTNEKYQEIFAKMIYQLTSEGNLPYITKSSIKNYCEKERKDTIKSKEEGAQRDFYFGRRNLPKDEYGKPIWFELQTGEIGQGKGIDLVYYDEVAEKINIFELKYNSKETLLRAVLEIQTYYQRIRWDRALHSLMSAERGKIIKNLENRISKYLLLNEGCASLKEYSELSADSWVKKLMDLFEIKVVKY